VALREGPFVAAAEYWTCPFPLPLVPALMVSQEALLAADHGHPAPAVTDTLPSPPVAGTAALDGEMT
jgi:hypothetical protein